MALSNVDGSLESCRNRPVDRKEANEGPEEQAEIDERTDPKDVKPPNCFAVIDTSVEYGKGQLDVPHYAICLLLRQRLTRASKVSIKMIIRIKYTSASMVPYPTLDRSRYTRYM